MIYAAFVIAVLIEIGLPFGLAVWFTRRFKTGWLLVLVGVLTFIGSQVVHIPLLMGFTALFQKGILPTPPASWNPWFNAVFLGLAAGLCEETARWVGYKIVRQRGKPFGAALTMGIGHGGIESVFVGVAVLANMVVMLLSAAGKGAVVGLSALQSAQAAAALQSTPWHLPLAGGVERILAISLHLTLSVLVWKAVVNRNAGWYVLAVLWHALVDFTAVLMTGWGLSAWQMEGVIGLFGIVNLIALVLMCRQAKRQEQAEAALAAATLPVAVEEPPAENDVPPAAE